MTFPGGTAYSGPKETKYLFVDGNYFFKEVSDIGKAAWDIEEPEPALERLGDQFTKVFYYDSPPPEPKGDEPESKRRFDAQMARYDRKVKAIRNQDKFHYFAGTSRRRKGKSTQKQVDVKLAVDMLTHSHRRNAHQITLLAGDVDFKPAIDALVLDGMFVTLWYAPWSTNLDLIHAADARRMIDLRWARDLLSPPGNNRLPEPRIQHLERFPEVCLEHTEQLQKREVALLLPNDGAGYAAYLCQSHDGLPLICQHEDLNILKAYLKFSHHGMRVIEEGVL